MKMRTSELARIMVAQGRLSQEAYDRIFGGGGIQEGSQPSGSPLNGAQNPGQAPADMPHEGGGRVPGRGAVGADQVPTTRLGGQDKAAGEVPEAEEDWQF